MEQFTPIQFAGGAYADETMPWSRQDTVNYLPVAAEKAGTATPSMLKTVPGMPLFTTVGTGPIRGMRNVEGRWLIVSGATLYWVNTNGIAVPIGTIPGVGRVDMAHNQITGGNEVLIATGVGGYVYNTVKGELKQITSDSYPGAKCVRFLGQYLVQVEPKGRYFFHSDLADATSYSTLDEYEAEAQPDLILGIEVSQGDLLVLGARTIEVWQNVVSENAAFQKAGVTIERGVASQFASAVLDNSVFFLGDDGVVYRLNGYTPTRVSTFPIEQALSKCDLKRAFAMAWEDRGHKVFYLTLQDGQTWGYDVSSGEWHRRKSFGLQRWRANALMNCGRFWLAGDMTSGKVYRLDWDSPIEGDQPLERERTLPVLFNTFRKMRVNAVRLMVDTGNKPADPPAPFVHPAGPSISGSAPDGQQGVAYSFTYTTMAGGASIVKTTIDETALLPGLSWNQATATISGTPTSHGSMTITPKVIDLNGLSASITDTITVYVYWPAMTAVIWDTATATGGSYATNTAGKGFHASTSTVARISANKSIASGDWYWETTTGWYLDSSSGINHFGQTGIIRSSDSATGLVLGQISSDGGAVATGGLFTDQVLYVGWIPPANVIRSARIRNRLTFSGSNATWAIAIDSGSWVTVMSGVSGTFLPYAISRQNIGDPGTAASNALIYSIPADFSYSIPDGAQPLALA